MGEETFWTLLGDLAHWEFELFLIFLFDVLIGLLIWPYIKKWYNNGREYKMKTKEPIITAEDLKRLVQKLKDQAPVIREHKKGIVEAQKVRREILRQSFTV